MSNDDWDMNEPERFICTDEQWDAFVSALNAPARYMPNLNRLFQRESPFADDERFENV